MAKNEMSQKDFKLVGSISMMSNLAMGFWVLFLICLGVMFYKLDVIFITLAAAMLALYLVTAFLGYLASKRLDEIEFLGTAKKYSETAKYQAKWVLMPIPFTITMGYLRKSMWEYNSQQRTKDMSLESDIIRENIKITKELKSDGYISKYRFDKSMPALEEELEKSLALEEKKRNAPKPKPVAKKSAKEIEDEKWA